MDVFRSDFLNYQLLVGVSFIFWSSVKFIDGDADECKTEFDIEVLRWKKASTAHVF